MLNSYDILKAMDGVADDKLHAAGRFLGYIEPRRSQRRKRKKLWRTLLLAAVIASLLGVTAYAAGWFGLKERVQPAPPPISYTPNPNDPAADILEREPGGYLSKSGYLDSPEALAGKEWQEFYWSYTQQNTQLFDESWQPPEKYADVAMVYPVFDQVMLDKLLEIADKYGLTLYCQRRLLPGSAVFHSMSGVGDFVLDDSFREKDVTAVHYLFDEGSFYIQAPADIDGEELFVTVSRARSGMLDPIAQYIYDLEKYNEDSYVNLSGDQTAIAWLEGEVKSSYVFYEQEGYLVTVSAQTNDPKALADMFDLEALCQGESRLLEALEAAENIKVKPKDGLMTLMEFVQTPEYKAGLDFNELYMQIAMEKERQRLTGYYQQSERLKNREVEIYPHQYYYYDSYPTGYQELDQKLEELLEQYPLFLPTEAEAIYFNQIVPAEIIISPHSYLSEDKEIVDKAPEATIQDHLDMTAGKEYVLEGEHLNSILWDNGVWEAMNTFAHGTYELAYIPKGCFYPNMPLFDGELTGYAYNTACGEQVYIGRSSKSVRGNIPLSVLLYETEQAYVMVTISTADDQMLMQQHADSIDFTVFQ